MFLKISQPRASQVTWKLLLGLNWQFYLALFPGSTKPDIFLP
jgi:hypothetical protein